MTKGYIVCLCDITGTFAEPWLKFGYTAILIDPQHTDRGDETTWKLALTVEEAMPFLSLLITTQKIAFVTAFPPCTELAVSGAGHWEEKGLQDRYFQARAVMVAEQCRTFAECSGAPYFIENPVSALSSIFGPYSHSFSPWEYSGYDSQEDNYTKKTCLWIGNGFIMPEKKGVMVADAPDDRIFRAAPGPERANFRSATPRGFSIAAFLANCRDFSG